MIGAIREACLPRRAPICSESQVTSWSPVSSHSRQIQSLVRASRALRTAGTIVTPQAGQIGGRSSSIPEVWGDEPQAVVASRAVRRRTRRWRPADSHLNRSLDDPRPMPTCCAYYRRMRRVDEEDPTQLAHAVAKGVDAVFMRIERMSL
jgi:hypothetical protein